MKRSFWVLAFGALTVMALAPQAGLAQTRIFVDVPSGETFSPGSDSAPAASVVTNEWATVEGFGELTGDSVRPTGTGDLGQAEGELFQVSVEIPEAGEWWLWVHYNFPFNEEHSYFVTDADGNYISSSDGPGADPAPLLNDDRAPFGLWSWDGSPGADTSIDQFSMGASLGDVAAGEYTLNFYRRESAEGTGDAAADPAQNPHFELIYLTNGGADDVPSDDMFLATQPVSGLRTIDPQTYPSFGGPIDISVTVRPEQGVDGALTVTEGTPEGLTVSDISTTAGSASIDGPTITWDIPSLTEPVTLTYTVFVNSSETATFTFNGTITGEGVDQPVSGQADLGLQSFFIFETFAYPLNFSNENEGAQLTEVEQPLGGGATTLDNGWATFWSDAGDTNDALSTRIIDAGLVTSQPQEFNPGNFSLEVSGDGGAGVSRSIDPVGTGEVWVSFTFLDEGPAADHWAGMTLYNAEGEEVSFVGKPFNSEFAGLGNLPDGDSLSDVDYTVPNHYLVRYVLQSGPGQNDSVYLWVNPDETDSLASYDAGGEMNDVISDIAEIRLRRGDASGSAYWDNIVISSVPALPPEGFGRAQFYLNDPDNRPAEYPAFDVVSVDQFEDGTEVTGNPGFGHDTGDNHYLVVSGYIYFENADLSGEQLVGFGLPPDHISGLNGHLLADYSNGFITPNIKNSIKFEDNDAQRGPFTFDIEPAGNYAEVRVCGTVGNGDGELFATFNYEDGTTSEGVLHGDDWFDDPPGLRFPDTLLLINGMNRLGGDNSFDGRFDPAFFDNAEEVDPDKVLTSVTLELNTDLSSPAFNMFSLLAIPEEAVVGVEDWSLF